ncbi:MAG: CinA family nicotinamide mononucleotide deamidase-related protein [Bacteroidales bacterium]|nr:CinA family nicotinamide mononucleotide deamidase-related protein [Bacteroidales bacterium]
MKATILNIGDELLIGQVVNTNASRMAQMLVAAGIDVCGTYVIGDNADDIKYYLRLCIEKSNVVLMTGGLGPTKDDITKKTLCELFDSELYENEEVLANIKRIFEARGYELTPINRQQAWVPCCCTMINNVLGTAPCMWFGESPLTIKGDPPLSMSGKVLVSMPGVPFEMVNLMETEVIPRLQRHFRTDQIVNKNILIQGIGESFLSDLIEPWELALPKNIRLAYLPQAGMLKLRLTARGGHDERPLLEQQIADAMKSLYPIAGQYIVGEELESLPELVAYTMKKEGKTLATAESCTGGTLAHQLTAMAGASEYYRGGVVAYSNEVKECALGVRHETLAAHGAVSEETVREMAAGVRERLGADYAVATTGIAGPGGGTPEKPVGTVWIAVAGPDGVTTKHLKFGDCRAQTIERTCNAVWAELIKNVLTC